MNLMIADMMKIDCEKVCKIICNFVREQIELGGYDGALIGVSGGVDSAVGVSLLVKALGAERVSGYP